MDAQLNWDDLRYVLALSRHRTLSAAAAELQVRHTTVARRIERLEALLDARLFDRQPEGYFPTQAGEHLLETARRMEGSLHDLDLEMLGADARLSGPLRVTTTDVMAYHHAGIFERFCRANPEVCLELVVDTRFQSLSRREADVALRTTNKPDEALFGRKLCRFEYAVYGARQLIERAGKDAPLAALPWVHWDRSIPSPISDRWLREHVPEARFAARVDSMLMLETCVRRGLGLALLITAFADSDPDLVCLGPRVPSMAIDHWILTHPHLRHTARIRAFMDHLVSELADDGKAG